MFKTRTILLSVIFLLLPATQSISLANNSNNIQEKTYNFFVGSLASGSFTGTDTNGNSFLETSEISDFSLSVKESNSDYQCEADDLKKLVYESPELKFNNQVKDLENKIFKYIEREEGLFIRTKETPIRSAIVSTIKYAFDKQSDDFYMRSEGINIFFQRSLREAQVSEAFFKDKTTNHIKQMIIDLQTELKADNSSLSSMMNKGNNIYVHCSSEGSNSKIELILDNQQKEGMIRGSGSYSLKLSSRQGFLNGSSISRSGMIFPGSIVVEEKQLDMPVSSDSNTSERF